MALCLSCPPATYITTLDTAICEDMQPVGACASKLMFVQCSVPQAGLVGGSDQDRANALTAAFTNAQVLVSPFILDFTENDANVETIPMGDCLSDFEYETDCTITGSTRQTWSVVTGSTVEDGATLFHQQLTKNSIYRRTTGAFMPHTPGKHNIFKIDCDGNIFAAANPSALGNNDVLATPSIRTNKRTPKIGKRCVETHNITLKFNKCPEWIHLFNSSLITDPTFLSQLATS